MPLHADATANIRPRLFLEGNFYVDLHPGSPEAPALSSGATLPAAQDTGPVQLDRVLSALDSNSRSNLQTLLRGFGGALNGQPTAADDATQDPSERGKTAGEALNDSLKYSANAFKASAIVNEALLGTQPQDLSGVVSGAQRLFGALSSESAHLSHLVTAFNTTVGALAARQDDLQQTIALLPSVLQATDNALGPLQASFGADPAVRRRADAVSSSSSARRSRGAAVAGAVDRAVLTERAAGAACAADAGVQGTSATLPATKTLLQGSDELARCFINDVIPTGNENIADPPITTGLQVYQELFQSAVGLASSAQNFDGNGRYVRASTGGGVDRESHGIAARRRPAVRQRRGADAGQPPGLSRATPRRSTAPFPVTATRPRT